MSMKATIQFIKGIDETTIPTVNITRSRDGSTGTATFTFDNANILYKMLAALQHRGPDDSGTYTKNIEEKWVHLGQNRLAIQDTSEKGHQPFISNCGNYVLVFNGEIYNFPRLRRELESKGYRFRSQSDTEVLVYMYEEYGEDMIHHLDGDFGFGIWDTQRRQLFLARDRFGVKHTAR